MPRLSLGCRARVAGPNIPSTTTNESMCSRPDAGASSQDAVASSPPAPVSRIRDDPSSSRHSNATDTRDSTRELDGERREYALGIVATARALGQGFQQISSAQFQTVGVAHLRTSIAESVVTHQEARSGQNKCHWTNQPAQQQTQKTDRFRFLEGEHFSKCQPYIQQTLRAFETTF